MRIYLHPGSVPELARVPELVRKRLWKDAIARCWRHPRVWVALFGAIGVMLLLIFSPLSPLSPSSSFLAHLVLLVLPFLLITVGVNGVIFSAARKELRAMMGLSCPSCGYSRRGLAGGDPVCPECGRSRAETDAGPDDDADADACADARANPARD